MKAFVLMYFLTTQYARKNQLINFTLLLVVSVFEFRKNNLVILLNYKLLSDTKVYYTLLISYRGIRYKLHFVSRQRIAIMLKLTIFVL